MTRVVVFSAHGGDVLRSLPEPGPADEMTVVRFGPGAQDATAVEDHQSVSSERLVTSLSRSLPGRLIVRALPLDTGARFWRSTMRSPAIAELVDRADLLVAADRDSGFAVWQWRRRVGKNLAAVRGIPAARTWLEQRRTP
jgi:hypothetical protein